MTYIVNSAQMKMAEENSAENGVSLDALMKNAALAVYNEIKALTDIKNKRFAVLCGGGNNGGDGVQLAFLLKEGGGNVTVLLTKNEPDTDTAKACARSREGKPQPPRISLENSPEAAINCVKSADVIIDCVFGTGFHGRLPEDVAQLFAVSNRRRRPLKISVDIPGGINGDSGEVCENAFRPDVTYVLAAMKTGLLNHPAYDMCGEVKVLDIGITEKCYAEYDGIFTPPSIKEKLPARPKSANKGNFGRLLNIAGSEKYIGAAILSCKGALRSGAGFVTLSSVPKVLNVAPAAVPECIFVSRDESDFDEALEKATAVTIGCGMGNGASTLKMLKKVLRKGKCPVVIDADGINCLKDNIYELEDKDRPLILTPHPGELARLLGLTAEQVQKDRINVARRFAAKTGAVILLKGTNTVIASPEGRIFVNPTGNTALAKAGTGDVLTGLIGGLLAQGTDPFDAAVLGAYLHGLSADILVKSAAPASVTAGDVADNLGRAML